LKELQKEGKLPRTLLYTIFFCFHYFTTIL